MQPDVPSPPPPPTSCNQNPNPNPYHPLQALHFLRLLAKINGSGSGQSLPVSPVPATSVRRRSICIRRAAYASMAYAVGPRRAWSRALLRRLRRRGRRSQLAPVARRIRRDGRVVVSTRGGSNSKPAPEATRTDQLRRLVPGGRSLDICSLLDETRHYIQCLGSQVRVMQSVVNAFPTDN